jgi:hypothetical protein
MKFMFLLFIALTTLAATAIGQDTPYGHLKLNDDGADLLRECHPHVDGKLEDDFEKLAYGMCMGTVQSVADLMWIQNKACFDHITIEQKIAVTVKWLEDHPKDWNQMQVALVWVALRDAFPCKKAKAGK